MVMIKNLLMRKKIVIILDLMLMELLPVKIMYFLNMLLMMMEIDILKIFEK